MSFRSVVFAIVLVKRAIKDVGDIDEMVTRRTLIDPVLEGLG